VCAIRQIFEVNAGQHIWRLLNKAVVCWIVSSVHVCVCVCVCLHITTVSIGENLRMWLLYSVKYCCFIVYLPCIYTNTKVWASRINTSKRVNIREISFLFPSHNMTANIKGIYCGS